MKTKHWPIIKPGDTEKVKSGSSRVRSGKTLHFNWDEAVGKFVRYASKRFPEHSIHLRPVFIPLTGR